MLLIDVEYFLAKAHEVSPLTTLCVTFLVTVFATGGTVGFDGEGATEGATVGAAVG